jgi:nucleolar GTP-binding protein
LFVCFFPFFLLSFRFLLSVVIIVANKIDVTPYTSLSEETKNKIERIAKLANAEIIPMSNISDENISQLKITACDKLLEARVDSKLEQGKVKNDVMSRITVAMPKPRDNVKRDICIPNTVKQISNSMDIDGSASASGSASSSSAANSNRVTEKQHMWNNGGPGVYICDYRKYYTLESDEWKYDNIPEIMNGKNVLDFFDPDIEDKLNALEEEEAELEENGVYDEAFNDNDDDEELLDEEDLLLYDAIKEKQIITRAQSHQTKLGLPKQIALKLRSEEDIKQQLEKIGLEADGVIAHTRGRKRERSTDRMDVDEEDGREESRGRSKARSQSVEGGKKKQRPQSATRGTKATSVAPYQEKQVAKSKKTMERAIFRYARGGEADRRDYPKLVKHLNSGKRSLGTSTIGR